jgi:hypothetical protein
MKMETSKRILWHVTLGAYLAVTSAHAALACTRAL